LLIRPESIVLPAKNDDDLLHSNNNNRDIYLSQTVDYLKTTQGYQNDNEALNHLQGFNSSDYYNTLPANHQPEYMNPRASQIIKSVVSHRLSSIPFNCYHMNPNNYYDIQKVIGKGGSGIIYLAKNKQNQANYAIKEVEIFPGDEEQLQDEIKVTMDMNSENIIKYHECYFYDRKFWIVEELMMCSLADMILDIPGRIPECIISYILMMILRGLFEMHKRRRIHRDIKSDNVLISCFADIKLADLGYVAQLDAKRPTRTTLAGTLFWMPPEILNEQPYTEKIDIWSLGIVAHELATGEPPYYRCQKHLVMANIKNRESPKLDQTRWSQMFVNFVDWCLVKNPNERADVSFLLAHPFLKTNQATYEQFWYFYQNWLKNRGRGS
jgi:serine/threonine protein kinase